ncbi:MAG: recombinase family protein [Burkholderia sp.]|jgi:DNA invertase Pin-like site-specific DNA recombinase|uniref:recombinase family protein n=1 Tax=Burkholderia sp. TaxID=36773 RepID=UPI002833BE80|nr:recombinase family protein [Burkholderia sp.]MDR0242650.1 recombinase family protein [Burkholderia sp.]
MKIGYARVSSDEQHLDMQIDALQAYGCDVIFSDQGISGASFQRPGLNHALEAAVAGTTIVVWRLDRLGRSLINLISLINSFREAKVHFVSLTESIDTGSPVGRFTFHLIAALAEFERALISERTRAGLASARSRGKRLGRPRVLDAEQRVRMFELLEKHSKAEVAKIMNIDYRTLGRYMSRENQSDS